MFDLLEEKIWFWTLLIIPVILVLFLLLQIWKQRAQNQFADVQVLNRLSPNKSFFKSVLKIIVLCLAFACLSIQKMEQN